ncbi:MAG: hypothetical protein Q4G52_05415 [Clostridia bacterium]|nr:hypothetical protein [Clostridia bacterium]
MKQLAACLHISQQRLSSKMLKNSFKEEELVEIAGVCDATFECTFTLNDTKRII